MKSVQIKGKRKFDIKEIEEPSNKEGYVSLAILKSGICGSDIHYWEAGEPKGLIMGHEFCGIVLDPADRSDLKEGDRVTALPISPCGNCDACLSGNHQYCLETWNHAVGLSLDNPGGLTSKINVRSDMVMKIPYEVSDEEAAMVEPTAVALHAIHLANIKVGDKVLVIGGGVIGLESAMFAKKEGASLVIVSETNEARGKKSVELGVADSWVDAKDENTIPNLITSTNGGFDVVIECCGNAPAVTTSLTTVKPGGVVVLVGVSMGPITIPTVLQVMRELKVLGAIGYTKEEFASCIDLIATKQIDVTKFISEIVGLEEVQESYEKLTNGTTDVIKILVDPSEDKI